MVNNNLPHNLDQLYSWTLSKIEDDPKLFGGDAGNPAIIAHYLQTVGVIDTLDVKTLASISNAVAVSRCKNKILLDHPEYDSRVKNKPKYRQDGTGVA